MKKYIIIIGILLFGFVVQAQEEIQYRRSSLYSMLLCHPEKKMIDEITTAYMKIQIPEKFNDHDLSVKYVTIKSVKTKSKETDLEKIERYLNDNQVAKRMVSKWFDRDKKTGGFDINLLSVRGQYNASDLDIKKAMASVRGKAMLQDAGEELLNNTFVIVNDIKYFDKEEQAQKAALAFQIIGAIFGALGGGVGDLGKSMADLGKAISDMIAGFQVNITTYLYQLDWNEEVANTFFQNYYTDKTSPDANKKTAYENDKNLFKLKFIGQYTARSSKAVMRGMHKPEDVFRKVLARAIDENVVELQKKYEVFKVKVPLLSTSPIKAKIGMKEGLSANSKFEVLEKSVDESGKTTYKRVGVIEPETNKIWDNRFGADSEKMAGSDLAATTFKKVNGGDFYPGMLIREIKF